MILIIIVGTQF